MEVSSAARNVQNDPNWGRGFKCEASSFKRTVQNEPNSRRGRAGRDHRGVGRGQTCKTNPISPAFVAGRCRRSMIPSFQHSHRRPEVQRLSCQTKPIFPGATRSVSALHKGSYDESDTQTATAKQSQFRDDPACTRAGNATHAPGGAGCTNKANSPTSRRGQRPPRLPVPQVDQSCKTKPICPGRAGGMTVEGTIAGGPARLTRACRTNGLHPMSGRLLRRARNDMGTESSSDLAFARRWDGNPVASDGRM